jgi:hypothetical protein
MVWQSDGMAVWMFVYHKKMAYAITHSSPFPRQLDIHTEPLLLGRRCTHMGILWDAKK